MFFASETYHKPTESKHHLTLSLTDPTASCSAAAASRLSLLMLPASCSAAAAPRLSLLMLPTSCLAAAAVARLHLLMLLPPQVSEEEARHKLRDLNNRAQCCQKLRRPVGNIRI